MTDVVIPFFKHGVVKAEVGQEQIVNIDLLLYQDARPMWLKHLRIYELAPALGDPVALDVLADALEIRDRDSVDAIIREYGIVGCWRPSSVIVQMFIDQCTQRILAEGVVAHALWNTDLHKPCGPNCYFRLDLEIDHPAQREEECRVFRPVAHFTEMTEAELRVLRGEPEPLLDLAIERRIENLERVVKVLSKFAKQTNAPLVELLIKREKNLPGG